MSTLAVYRLFTYVSQPITVRRDLLCGSIRLKLYSHDLPDGTFSISILKGTQDIFTITFTSVDLQQKIDTSDRYFWGDFAFPVNFYLDRGDYEIRLDSSGYVFSESRFLGWVKDFDEIDRDIIGEANDFSQYPFSFNLIEYKQREVI
jgi:hypothetical protein